MVPRDLRDGAAWPQAAGLSRTPPLPHRPLHFPLETDCVSALVPHRHLECYPAGPW